MEKPPVDWLASGGAYWVIFGQTLFSAAFFVAFSLWFGKTVRAHGDGCLLAIATFLFALLGSAIGFLLFPYPRFIIGSLVGTIVMPLVVTLIFTRLIRRR